MIGLVLKPDPRLKKQSIEVDSRQSAADVRALVDAMLDVMYSNEGVGLAAPQVGSNVRVIVVDPSNGEVDNACRVMVNPVLVEPSPTKEVYIEGCLSIPGELYYVERPVSALVRWQDIEGKTHQIWLHDAEARIFLHELDHLSGVLISDIGTRATFKPCEDQ